MILLTRDAFRESVFERDGHKCVICKEPAQDAHHILERRLFPDGGYYLDNGASVCGPCHIKAEQTEITVEDIREAAGIKKVVLPPHMYGDNIYDKWGNIILNNGSRLKGELFFDESVQKILENVLDRFIAYVKYPRTFHLPFSLGRTDDDRVGTFTQFTDKEVVITEKMDGENTTGYFDGYVHARSVDGLHHESRDWVKAYLATKLYELPEGWRICGENLFAKHSIHYKELESYFLGFSIWNERNECLSWKETMEWFQLLEIPTVRILYEGKWNPEFAIDLATEIDTRSRKGENTTEGYIVRLADQFPYGAFSKSVGKMVRANHVQTNQHWIRTAVVPNILKT